MRLYFILCIFLINCSKAKSTKIIETGKANQEVSFNTLKSFDLKGKVSSVNQYTYEIKSFNQNVELGDRSDGVNEPEFYNILEFNDKGYLTSGVSYFSGSKDFDFKDEFIYYQDSLLIQQRRYFTEGVTNMHIWNYNFNSNEIEIIGTQAPIHRAGSAYPYNKIILKINDVGNISERIHFTNNLPSKIGYSDYGEKTIYEYNTEQKLVKEVKYLGDEIWSINNYKYKNGLISNMERTKSSNLKLKFEYKYDQNGNWNEKIDFVNNEPKYITLRKVTYKK